MNNDLYDVVAVNNDLALRVMARDKTQENADAYVLMAVCRRGVDDEFFAVVPAGKYNDGDKWGKA